MATRTLLLRCMYNTLIVAINLFGKDVIRVLDNVACHLHSGTGAIFF